jgi:hypothetical protein
MPLFQSSSKKALKKNIETEMDANPSPEKHKQNLAIAFSVQRKNKGKKKMAKGGEVSAGDEKRPMPDDTHNDSQDVSQNSGKKPPKDDNWLDQPTVKQAGKLSITPMSQPKMVGSDAFSVRMRDLQDHQDDLEQSDRPSSYTDQPPAMDDEMDAAKSGDPVSDNERQHNNGKPAYADGGRIDIDKTKITADSLTPEEMEMIHEHRMKMASGGMLPDMEPTDHGIQEHLRAEESDLHEDDAPSEDMGASVARGFDEDEQDRYGNPVSDNERQHSDGKPAYKKGGKVTNPKLQQSHVDLEDDHPEDVASAIMKNRKSKEEPVREKGLGESDSIFDFPRKKKMADGGPIKSEDSIYSDDSDQADISRNADEDANMEDQSSYNSLRKENYNDSEGLNQIDRASKMDSGQHGDDITSDVHDLVDKIRNKIRKRI